MEVLMNEAANAPQTSPDRADSQSKFDNSISDNCFGNEKSSLRKTIKEHQSADISFENLHFKVSIGFRRELFKSRDEKYACLNPNCKSVFNDKSNRNRHFKHQCAFSSLWFAGNLMETSIQVGPPQYACPNPNCNRVFSKKYNRNAHVNLYCGKPPRFKCPHCDYKSLLKRNIKDHAFRMHSDLDAKVIELYNPAEGNKSGGETKKVGKAVETLCEPDIPLLTENQPE